MVKTESELPIIVDGVLPIAPSRELCGRDIVDEFLEFIVKTHCEYLQWVEE